MQYTEKSALPLIEAAYSNMTQTEKGIANYFLEENEPSDLSLKNMASLLAVSEATLVRFAKKCGFKGYREFIFQYGNSLETKKTSENIAQSSLQVLNAYQDLLTKSYSLIREEQICKVAQMISEARRVYVGGIGSSGYAAREMAYRFMRVGVGIEAFDDVDMMRMISVFRDDQDLVFGLSLSGTRPEFLEYLSVAHQRKAKTVLITSSPREYFKEFVDEVIIVPSLLHLNHGNLISPQFPLLVMIDILYAAYMRQNRREKENLHGQTVQLVERTQIQNDSQRSGENQRKTTQ
ncbi:MurR/RpiR family transcriptional regulator [Erysipelotrichaceae bacterium RD49]|nr:MurR/RpiR family transcriptional regulator [Erysipelotrichaceae bacterium RD49]